jgi:hypothetical protein
MSEEKPEDSKTIEDFFKAKKTPRWLEASARRANRWAIGKVVTEAEFNEGIKAANVAVKG